MSTKLHKNWAQCNFNTKSVQVLNFRSRYATSNIIFMINKLDLLRLANFITLGIYFIFGTKFSWNEGIDTCFNVKCVLLGRNFDFLGGYLFITCSLLVVTAHYVVVTGGYCRLLGGYCQLLLVNHHSSLVTRYCSLLLAPAFSMNDSKKFLKINFHFDMSD